MALRLGSTGIGDTEIPSGRWTCGIDDRLWNIAHPPTARAFRRRRPTTRSPPRICRQLLNRRCEPGGIWFSRGRGAKSDWVMGSTRPTVRECAHAAVPEQQALRPRPWISPADLCSRSGAGLVRLRASAWPRGVSWRAGGRAGRGLIGWINQSPRSYSNNSSRKQRSAGTASRLGLESPTGLPVWMPGDVGGLNCRLHDSTRPRNRRRRAWRHKAREDIVKRDGGNGGGGRVKPKAVCGRETVCVIMCYEYCVHVHFLLEVFFACRVASLWSHGTCLAS